jgi:TRAP-type uncharacterized transport system substrate-binding protein
MMKKNKNTIFLYIYYFVIPALAFSVFLFSFFYYHPPSSVKIISGPKGGFFSSVAEDLKSDLDEYGVKSEIEYIENTTDIINLIAKDRSQKGKIGFLAQEVDGKDYPDIYSLGAIAIEPLLIFSRVESDIRDIRELKGKRLAIGPIGSGVRDLSKRVLSFYGIDESNTAFLNEHFYEASNQLIDGSADAAFFLLPINTPVISELVKHDGLRLVSIPEARAVSKKISHLTNVSIPRGAFRIEPVLPRSNIPTVALPVSVILHESAGVGLGGLVAALLAKRYKKDESFSEKYKLPDFFYDEIKPMPVAEDIYVNGDPVMAPFIGLKYGLMLTYASAHILLLLASLIILWGIVITYVEIVPVLIDVVRLFRKV